MRRLLLVLFILILCGCIDSSDDNDATGAPGDNRAYRWIRSNPLFVSAINVSMGAPPSTKSSTASEMAAERLMAQRPGGTSRVPR